MAQNVLANTAIRRQVLIERFKQAQVEGFLATLAAIDRDIRARLSGSNVTEFSRARLEAQLVEVRALVSGHYSAFVAKSTEDMREFSADEAEEATLSLDRVAKSAGYSVAAPGAEQVWATVTARPLAVRGASGSLLLEPFMKEWGLAETEAVISAIQQGYFEGQTNDQIIQRIRGTRALGYKDGLLEVSRRHAEAVVRTSIQHVANVARNEVWAENDDIVEGYQWLATLDSRTTPICQGLDGQQFKVGKGPLPPAHVNCRSTTIPVLVGPLAGLSEGGTRASANGYVDKDLSYYDWLKTQSPEFQDLALGPTRAQLLRDGGLTSEQFAKLNLSKSFQPMTLAEMRTANPEAFAKAGLTAGASANKVEQALRTVREAQGYTITGNPIPAQYGPGMNVKNAVPYSEDIAARLNKFANEDRARITNALLAHRNGETLLPIEDLAPSKLMTIQPTVTREGLEYRIQNPGFVATNPYDTPQITVFRIGGRDYVWDGNHRAMAALLTEEESIQALVVDLGE